MLSSRAIIRATRASAGRSVFVPKALPGTAFRAYATPSGSADSKPPVALYGLDGTYASALVC
jgi:F-type H+-transporting ATPase subunit O